MDKNFFTHTVVVEREDMMPRMKFFLHRAGFHGPIDSAPPDLYTLAYDTYKLGMETSVPAAYELAMPCDALPHRLIPGELRGAARYSLLAFTLGAKLDCEIERLMTSSPLSAVYLDAWGSESVENIAERIDSRLRKTCGEGSRRFAPGYGTFDIRNNIEILDIIRNGLDEENQISFPIEAHETGILEPKKSIVCMIGWKAGITHEN